MEARSTNAVLLPEMRAHPGLPASYPWVALIKYLQELDLLYEDFH